MQSPFQILYSTSSTSNRRSRIVARAQPLGAPSCFEAVFDGSTKGTVNCSCHPLSHHPFPADMFVKFCRCREPPQTPLPHERHLSIVPMCQNLLLLLHHIEVKDPYMILLISITSFVHITGLPPPVIADSKRPPVIHHL